MCVRACVLTSCTRRDRIGNLKNLTSLMLFYTQLRTLPDEFCTLLNLKSLHLGSNEVLTRTRSTLPIMVMVMMVITSFVRSPGSPTLLAT